eukprot:scpid85588/ scgid9089/ 
MSEGSENQPGLDGEESVEVEQMQEATGPSKIIQIGAESAGFQRIPPPQAEGSSSPEAQRCSAFSPVQSAVSPTSTSCPTVTIVPDAAAVSSPSKTGAGEPVRRQTRLRASTLRQNATSSASTVEMPSQPSSSVSTTHGGSESPAKRSRTRSGRIADTAPVLESSSPTRRIQSRTPPNNSPISTARKRNNASNTTTRGVASSTVCPTPPKKRVSLRSSSRTTALSSLTNNSSAAGSASITPSQPVVAAPVAGRKPCGMCPETFSTVLELIGHISTVHADDPATGEAPSVAAASTDSAAAARATSPRKATSSLRAVASTTATSSCTPVSSRTGAPSIAIARRVAATSVPVATRAAASSVPVATRAAASSVPVATRVAATSVPVATRVAATSVPVATR